MFRLKAQPRSKIVSRALTVTTLVSLALALGPLASPAMASPEPDLPEPTVRQLRPAADGTNQPIARAEIMRRAETWMHPPRPYSQKRRSGGYRTDCSGFVSMAWHLSTAGGGATTVSLKSAYTRPISKYDLKAGDILLDASGDSNNRHVVLFEEWIDAGKTRYRAYEQSGSGSVGTKHHVIPYPYFGNRSQYSPYRYNKVAEVKTPVQLRVTDLVPLAGDWDGNGTKTVGLYNRRNATFMLRNSNTAGEANLTVNYGAKNAADLTPVVGDWDGNGTDTIGVYYEKTGVFHLRNSNSPGPAQVTFGYGTPGAGFVPLVGDWDGNRTDTLGLYKREDGKFYLRNSNTPGGPDVSMNYGTAGAAFIPVAGDWDSDGTSTPGLHAWKTGRFYLRNTNTSGTPDVQLSYGAEDDERTPIAGDWDGNGTSTLGEYDAKTGQYYLRNFNTSGPPEISVRYGPKAVS